MQKNRRQGAEKILSSSGIVKWSREVGKLLACERLSVFISVCFYFKIERLEPVWRHVESRMKILGKEGVLMMWVVAKKLIMWTGALIVGEMERLQQKAVRRWDRQERAYCWLDADVLWLSDEGGVKVKSWGKSRYILVCFVLFCFWFWSSPL